MTQPTAEERQTASKLWPNDETMDFLITSTTNTDGVVWTWLRCSVHGGVTASTNWDLGTMNIAAIDHYVRKHLRLGTHPDTP